MQEQPRAPTVIPTYAPQPAYQRQNVVPIRPVNRNARLVRPLTREGQPVDDPYDVFMAGVPDITPEHARAVGMLAHVEALAEPGDAGDAGVAPENPFGGAPLRLNPTDLPR